MAFLALDPAWGATPEPDPGNRVPSPFSDGGEADLRRADPPSFRFRRITTADGLAQGSVYSLQQDRHGFIWVGTQDGLQRYDGHRFHDHKPDPFDPSSLSHGMVRSLLEDHSGELWVGTFRDLDRLGPAGVGFDRPLLALLGEPLKERYFASITVTELLEDERGFLWIGTESSGLYRLSPDRTEVVAYLAAEGRGRATTSDEWVRRASTEAPRLTILQNLPSARIRALESGPGGALWVGFEDAGLARLDPANGQQFEPVDLTRARPGPAAASRDPAASDFGVHDIAVDRWGRLWLALPGQGLGLLRPDEGDAASTLGLFSPDAGDPHSLSHAAVEVLEIDSEDRLWIGTLGGGLDLLQLTAPDEPFVPRFRHFRHLPSDPASLAHDQVRTILEDRSGLIWVGTAVGGLTLINTRPRFGLERADPDTPGSLPSNVVRTFLEDSRGDLWVGTDGGGVVRQDRQTGRFLAVPASAASPFPDSERVWSLYEDRDGHVWVGGQDSLRRYDPQTDPQTDSQRREVEVFRHDAALPDSLSSGSVRSMVQDVDGRLWVAHFGGGLSRLSRGESRFQRFRYDEDLPFTLPNDLALYLLLDSRQQLWIGTAEGLARRSSDGRFHAYRHDPANRSSLMGDIVRSIHQDRQGNLWVGTDAGLDCLPANLVLSPPVGTRNNHGFRHFSEADGLPDNTVYGILEDDAGHLWLSTNRGLARFDPSTREVTSFDMADGLQGLEYNGGAYLKGDDGTFYFGGVSGFNHFRPGDIRQNLFVPPVVITRLELAEERQAEPFVLEKPIWLTDEVVLPHDEPFVSLQLAALDYSDSQSNRYAYRIEGLDETWHELGTRNQLTLTGLDAGEYRLQVRGSNDDGVWNEAGTELRLRILPAPWLSAWALAAYGLLAVLLAGLAWRQVYRRRAFKDRLDMALRSSQRRLDLALRGSGDGLWDWNIETGEVYRYRIAEMLGYRPEELPSGHEMRRSLIHEEDQAKVEDLVQAHLRGETDRFEVEARMRDRSGRWRWILDRGTVVERNAEGRPVRMAGTFKDMTAHKEVESELRLWSTVFEAVDEGLIVIDTQDRVQAVNGAFCEMTGYSRDELLGLSARRLETPCQPDSFYRHLRHTLARQGSWEGELEQARKNGSTFPAWMELDAVYDDHGELSHYVGVVRDITQRKASEEELRRLANLDTLTGLPNRSFFQNQLAQALKEAQHQEGQVALIFGDLDQFKQVNDTLGHAFGDLLLQGAAERLVACVREPDMVARLGGDELTVLLRDIPGEETVRTVARRILDSFAEPLSLEGQEISVSISLGIALYPRDGEDGDALLKHADTAMYEAKAQGRNRYRFYAREMSDRALARMSLDNRLRKALQDDALQLYYQPKLDLETGKISGVEALVRWPQANGEVLLPSAFLDVAEETGLIVPVGYWVLRSACERASTWPEAFDGLDISINLSPSQLADSYFPARVGRVLSENRLDPGRLVLEVTEDALMEESGLRRLQELQSLGIRLSIDNFGTGFSSLGQLEKLSLDELKIDGSFVASLSDESEASIPRTILAMAGGLELEVVAVGVETSEQLRALSRAGCHRVQGYLVAAPMPWKELEAQLGSQKQAWDGLAPKSRKGSKKRPVSKVASGAHLRIVD